ncbi:ETS homologous factor isoform X2 [Accipiter gentilis]|uniref:ETS homologous factor isoform X2 n=1 Tax=Astur gentilis TaxID=8957 RepID=UPI00210F3F1A|nr:ETS homologous factor isoform X2 [Accipiter gentilis]
MILEGAGRMSNNSSSNLLHQQPSWTDGYSTCNVSSSFYGTQWHEIHPQYWTKFQVWEWLQHLLDTNQLDANCIPFQEFDINGEHLCSMSLQEFTQAAGTAGQLLYSNLQHLKWNGQCGSDIYQSHNVIVKTEQTDPSLMVSWKEDNYLYDSGYGSTVELLDSKTFCRAQISMMTPSHQPPDSSDVKKSQDHTLKSHTKKHNPRGTHLWEFIRDILLNPEKNPGLIKWEDRSEGVFRFLKSEAVAQLWGKKKNNSSMTYEKLSRAMRYYYKREILERVDGRRLVYKFGKNARGWRENEN